MHSDAEMDEIPTLSDNALSMDNIQVESNLPEPEDVDNMAFYEQEKVSNRRNISLEPSRSPLSKSPEFRSNANTTPPPQNANSNTFPHLSPTRSMIFSQSPVISDANQEYLFEVTDGELELFLNSKSVSERLPITMKILQQLQSYNEQGQHDLLHNLEEKIRPGLMTSVDFQNAPEKGICIVDSKAQNVANHFYPEEQFLVFESDASGNCFWSSCSTLLTSTDQYAHEAKLSSTCFLIREPNEVAKLVLEKEDNAGNGAGIELNLTDHNIMEEIKMCSKNYAFAGPFQIAAMSLGEV